MDLDSIKVEAFALVREVADRRLGMWQAIADEKLGFDAWGDQLSTVTAAREQLAEGATPWSINLPASVYDAIRTAYPDSKPPFRMRAHDVQLIGGLVLHEGRIAELKLVKVRRWLPFLLLISTLCWDAVST